MEIMSIHFLTALGTIVLMDILLGGDNAVVIAMAANKLPLTAPMIALPLRKKV